MEDMRCENHKMGIMRQMWRSYSSHWPNPSQVIFRHGTQLFRGCCYHVHGCMDVFVKDENASQDLVISRLSWDFQSGRVLKISRDTLWTRPIWGSNCPTLHLDDFRYPSVIKQISFSIKQLSAKWLKPRDHYCCFILDVITWLVPWAGKMN